MHLSVFYECNRTHSLNIERVVSTVGPTERVLPKISSVMRLVRHMKRRTVLQLGGSLLLATTAGCSFPRLGTSSGIAISKII